MLLTGSPISAQEALLHGLISRVVPEGRLEEETLAIARRVCRSSRPVVALGKATFYRYPFLWEVGDLSGDSRVLSILRSRQMAQGRDAAYATASRVMVENLALPDGQEGIRAFLEKRRLAWSHAAENAAD